MGWSWKCNVNLDTYLLLLQEYCVRGTWGNTASISYWLLFAFSIYSLLSSPFPSIHSTCSRFLWEIKWVYDHFHFVQWTKKRKRSFSTQCWEASQKSHKLEKWHFLVIFKHCVLVKASFSFVLLAFLEWERTQSKEILASHWCNSFLICYYVVLLKRTDGRGLAHEKKCLPSNRAFFSKPVADATLFSSLFPQERRELT